MAIRKVPSTYERCKGVLCEGCGDKPAAARGLCRNCYVKSKEWLTWTDDPPRIVRNIRLLPFATCIICGAEYRPKRGDRTTCCSRKCGLRWSSYKSVVRRNGGRASVVVHRSRCAYCEKPFTPMRGARYCSDECYIAKRAERHVPCDYVPRTFNCGECGVEVVTEYGSKAKRFCSSECGKRNGRRRKRKRDRALRYALKASSLDPTLVFDRDGWRCQICGRKTPRRKRGTYASNAPELDHIVPLSRGGPHTYANVQCSCRACNAAKSNGPGGQLLLFGEHVA